MKKFILAALLLLAAVGVGAQSKVEGVIRDTASYRNLPFVSVSVVDQKDSLLVAFTRTSDKGKFTFENLLPGNYILLASQNKYVDYVAFFTLGENQEKDFGNVPFTQRAQLLRSVVIKDQRMVRMKGDTLSFLADSFNVRKGAVVEDLLKVLPGMQVDKNGEITVMGEKVQKVLVNGEEFFGTDPTVATRNLQANVVEEVEVFDQKSDQAEFTGFDDGEEVKTINLKLKKDKSQGLFGKLEGGGALDDRWNNQAMLNWFEGKRQISAYGLMNSVGQTGLGWQDNMTYGSGGGNRRMFGGGEDDTQIISSFFEDEDDNSFGNFGRGANNPGINKTWKGGARYANKLDEGKHELSANYSQGRTTQELEQRAYTENVLPTFTSLRDDTTNSKNINNVHNVSGRYEWNIDSQTSVVYRLNGRLQFRDYFEEQRTNNRTDADVPLSVNNSSIDRSTTTSRVTNEVTLNRKLGKKGRTLSLSGSHTYNRKDGEGFLLSSNSYGSSGGQVNQLLDQRKEDKSDANSVVGTLSYTEPLTENVLLRVGYGISSDRADLSTITQDTLGFGLGNYERQIDSLSNRFDMNIMRNSGLVEVMYNKKKMNLRLGTSVAYSTFEQQDLIRNQSYNYSRLNVFPSVRLKFKFSQFKTLDINYTGSTTNPTAEQLQPIIDNTSPLSITIGNPDLKIGYRQNLRLNYFTFQALSGRGIWAGAFLQNAFNPVGLERTFDVSGRTVNRYTNLGTNYVASSWVGGMVRLNNNGWDLRTTISGSYSDMPAIVNGVASRNKSTSVTVNPSVNFNNEKIMSFVFEPNFSYNNTVNNVGVARTISYFSFTPTLGVSYYLPKDFELGTDMDYDFRPAVDPYPDNFSRFIWDAYVSKRVLPKKNLELRFQVWDLLNQNQGYNRTSTNNYNIESYFNTLKRYWMVSAVWNFYSGPLAESRANSSKSSWGGHQRRQRR